MPFILQVTRFNPLISRVDCRVIQPRTECHNNPFIVVKGFSSRGTEPLKVDALASASAQIKDLPNPPSGILSDATNTVGSESPSQNHDSSKSLASFPVLLAKAVLLCATPHHHHMSLT